MNISHMMAAAKAASTSADYTGANAVKIGCVVTYKGTILAKGANHDRTHPTQERFNVHRYKDSGNRYLPSKVHAECAALTKIKYLDIDFSRVTLFIYRGFQNGSPAMARPCAACRAYIQSLGIKHIWYTTDSGYAHEIMGGN